MGTGSMIPYSNPAGNNQTTPIGVLATGGPKLPGAVPTSAPGNPAAAVSSNPLIPFSSTPAGSSPVPIGAGSVPNVGGLTTTGANVAGDTGALQKQLVDIYGKGEGGALSSLLAGMSGTDSTILQEYIKSLAPEEATAQAGVNAALGAGGVSGNSSVAGLADANLQAQEFAAISGESAKLTQNQEMLTAELLQGMQPAAQKEVATSNWSIFGDVMGDIATDVGAVLHGGSGAMPGKTSSSPVPSGEFAGQSGEQIQGATGFYGDASSIQTSFDPSLDDVFI